MEPGLILGIGSAAVGALVQLKSQADSDKQELLISLIGAKNKSANEADKRGSGWGRQFALVVVLSVGFGGLFYSAVYDKKVSQIIEVQPIIDFLFIKIGGGQKVVEATGFVIPQYVEESIISIIFFLFGSSAAKR